jgi:parvulin-like peptidyl-prolyl isomerase
MKLHFVALPVLLISQVFAQEASSPHQTHATAATATPVAGAAPKIVAPDGPVISVGGVCKSPSVKTGDCKTVITRSEFERLMEVLSRQHDAQAQQSIPPEAKRQLALQYSRLLLFADLAEKQGLQNTPDGKVLINFLRLQAMTEELARSIQQKSLPTPAEINDYYEHHRDQYSQWDLQRIVVPSTPKAEGHVDQEQLKKVAENLYERASHGGDFDALQKEAFEKTGTQNPPKAEVVLTPGASIPEAHAAVYRLKPGEVSRLIEDPTGFYIYKLNSSTVVPLEQNKAAIQDLLSRERAQEAIQKLIESNKITLNSDYFELAPAKDEQQTSSVRPVGGVTAARVDTH